MRIILKLGLYSLGLAAILIGGSMALFGSHAVGTLFNNLLSLIYDGGPIEDLAGPNVDSELRFYGVMFAFYGGVLLQTARNIDRYFDRIPLLLAIFAIAGFARLIGYLVVGQPHSLFIALMAIEFVLPATLIICWYEQKKSSSY